MRPAKALRSLEQYGAENYSWRASTLCSLRPQNICRLWRQSGAQLLPRCSREPRYCAVHLIWRAARLQEPRCSRAAVRRPRLEVAAGVPTQLPGFVGAFVVALMLLLASSLLRNPPAARVSGGGNRFRHRLDRGHRPNSNLPYSALGVLAVDRLFRGCRRSWWDPGHRLSRRNRYHWVPLGRLTPALGCQGVPRYHAISRRSPDTWSRAHSMRCTVILCQC